MHSQKEAAPVPDENDIDELHQNHQTMLHKVVIYVPSHKSVNRQKLPVGENTRFASRSKGMHPSRNLQTGEWPKYGIIFHYSIK